MKILFAIQGTGNGHISRARDFIPLLQKRAEVDILISGTQFDVELQHDIKYNLRGAGFIFGKNGGVDYFKSLRNLRPYTFFNDIRKLNLKQYDVILNDFEPVSAWAGKFKKRNVIALSHQSAFLSPNSPRPEYRDSFAESVFKYYAPSKKQIAFHFEKYDEFINTPIIRKEIRALTPTNNGHYAVYLPAYDDKYLLKCLSKFPNIQWEIFSKHEKIGYSQGNVKVSPIHNENYNKSVANCEGLLTGAGFEAPAEAMYLGKKVLVVPMFGQYEQACNAEALKRLGVPVIPSVSEQTMDFIKDWTTNHSPIKVDFPDNIENVLDNLWKMIGEM